MKSDDEFTPEEIARGSVTHSAELVADDGLARLSIK
jgi:hypothetical protein